MEFLSVSEIAKLWNISERSVRNYCTQGRVPGAFLTGKTWNIPADAMKPTRSNVGNTGVLENQGRHLSQGAGRVDLQLQPYRG